MGKNGIDYYFQGDSSYGSTTMLKEEYISLDKAGSEAVKDTIETSRRIVETDIHLSAPCNKLFFLSALRRLLFDDIDRTST